MLCGHLVPISDQVDLAGMQPVHVCYRIMCFSGNATVHTPTRTSQMVELLFLRAICHHALGNVHEAVADYEACLSYQRPTTSTAPPLNEEARSFQYLSFYQKEMALYLYNSLDRLAASFCPDAELMAVFKVRAVQRSGVYMPTLLRQCIEFRSAAGLIVQHQLGQQSVKAMLRCLHGLTCSFST